MSPCRLPSIYRLEKCTTIAENQNPENFSSLLRTFRERSSINSMEEQQLKREESPSLGLQSSGEDETVAGGEKQVAAAAEIRGGEKDGDEDEEEAWKKNLEEVEEIVGYKFNDPNLLRQAFTHSSYRSECSYERLEYMGDSVLNQLITKEHYFLYPELPPGKLTPLRAFNVDTEKLARVAIKYNLHKYLRHRKPLLEGQVSRF